MCQYALAVLCIRHVPFISDIWPQGSQGEKKKSLEISVIFFDLNVREQSTVAHYLGNVKSNNVHFVGSSHAPLFKSQSSKFEMKMYLRQNDSQPSNRKNYYLMWDS